MEQFVERLSKNVGCYYHRNSRNYPLKKYNSMVKREMGLVCWVSEKKSLGRFDISTYKFLADEKGIRDADKEKMGAHFVSKGTDNGNATGLFYYVGRGCSGTDFQKAVRALRVIQGNR